MITLSVLRYLLRLYTSASILHYIKQTKTMGFLQNPATWQLLVESYQLNVGATKLLLRSLISIYSNVSFTMHRKSQPLASPVVRILT
ncbi:hypothetical protein, partial [Winogradskyella sp.]|uniref:hypothetical protein n=1 Tax=Winogradskyella sp. TaxID=1883156 RepID=UPI003703E4CF